MQCKLSQEESDSLKAGLYFSIQTDKIWKSQSFTTFEKTHHSFINKFKSKETKSQIKAHLLYLANSYFCNCKPSPHIPIQHRISWNLRKNKGIIIAKSNHNQLKDTSDIHYFKLPYICNLSQHIKKKISKLCKEFCKVNFNIKLVFNSFKDPIPDDLKSLLVYKFTCASCSSSYITETCHFKTRIEVHIKWITSPIFWNINTPSQHTLTHIIIFLLK